MWDQIKKAVETIIETGVKRVDGDDFKVYAVGSNIIRVDINTQNTQNGS